MTLPARDAELVQIMDAAFSDAALRAGDWLACRVGCTQCCHGAFAIDALDVARLQSGMQGLHSEHPALARQIAQRAESWLAQYGPAFPGDQTIGILGQSEEEQASFESYAEDAPCPALDPATGRCDVYAWRPMTCRIFGPPVRMGEGDELGCCELCFHGASDDAIAACEMPVPHELHAELTTSMHDESETLVAFALLRRPDISPR